MRRVFALFCSFLLLFAAPARAQQIPVSDRDKPLEITADKTLEWRRNDTQFVATGNVIVTQGEVTIYADMLTADYREGDKSSFEIYRLTAAGHVRISSQGNTAQGDRAIYNVDRGVAVMTGEDLRMSAPDQSVTAKESFEYWTAEGKLTARGDAHAVRGQDTLSADTLAAVFADEGSGSRKLKTLTADGHVRITTPTETLTGESGVYEAATNIASVAGNVKIVRGPNILEGRRAEVNLTTNVSTMQGGPGAGGRVRGVFYPGSGDGDAGLSALKKGREAPGR